MGYSIQGVTPFCQAVDCDKPTEALVSTLQNDWVAFCASHGVLQLAMQSSITSNSQR